MSEAVTLALSELRSLITKSARGAGLSWGMAEEAGWAAEWLARKGMPAADWAQIWLAARVGGAISPVEIGASLADEAMTGGFAKGGPLPDGVLAMGYLLPFLHRIAQDKSAVVIHSDSGKVVQVAPDGHVDFGAGWQIQSQGWSWHWATEHGHSERAPVRPRISEAVLTHLSELALATTVPQSEKSRQDAGSSTCDND